LQKVDKMRCDFLYITDKVTNVNYECFGFELLLLFVLALLLCVAGGHRLRL